jgi:DNA-binding CsgD family transcriptional regulator
VTSRGAGLSGGVGVAGAPSQLAILVVDDDRRVLEANLTACRLLGLPRRAALGSTVDDFLTTGMRKRLDHVWRAFREGGGHAGPFELSSESAEAPEVHISVTANVLPGRHLLVLSATQSHPGEVQAPAEASASPADEGGTEVPRERRFGRGGPTAREREILGLLAAGATDEQIAQMLELSPATVQTHVRNAKAKLGARTRAQAVALALQQGLINMT